MCGIVCATPTEIQEHRSTHSTKDEMPQPKKRPICIIRLSTENMDPICGNAAGTPAGLANHLQFTYKKSPSKIHALGMVVPQDEIETKKEPLRAQEGSQPVGVIKIQKKEPISVDPAIPEGNLQIIKRKGKTLMKCYVCGKLTIGRVGLTAHIRAHKQQLVTPINDQMATSVMKADTVPNALEDLEDVPKPKEPPSKDPGSVAPEEVKTKEEPLEDVQEVPRPAKNKRKMKCYVCGKVTISRIGLSVHIGRAHKKRFVTPIQCPVMEAGTVENALEDLEQVAKLADLLVKDSGAVAQEEIKTKKEPLKGVQEVPKPVGAKKVLQKRGIIVGSALEGGEVPELTEESMRDTCYVAQEKTLVTSTNDPMLDSAAMDTKETDQQDIPKLTELPVYKFKIPKLRNLPKIQCYVCGKVIVGSFGLKSHLQSHKKQESTMKQ